MRQSKLALFSATCALAGMPASRRRSTRFRPAAPARSTGRYNPFTVAYFDTYDGPHQSRGINDVNMGAWGVDVGQRPNEGRDWGTGAAANQHVRAVGDR